MSFFQGPIKKKDMMRVHKDFKLLADDIAESLSKTEGVPIYRVEATKRINDVIRLNPPLMIALKTPKKVKKRKRKIVFNFEPLDLGELFGGGIRR